MNRSARRIVAWLGILGIAFAQFAAAAHACGADAATGPEHRLRATAGVAVDASHCGGHTTGPVTPPANLCEVHCTDGARPTAALDLPAVALAPLPVPAGSLAGLATAAALQGTPTLALATAPTLILQFCRLLI